MYCVLAASLRKWIFYEALIYWLIIVVDFPKRLRRTVHTIILCIFSLLIISHGKYTTVNYTQKCTDVAPSNKLSYIPSVK